MGDEWTTLSETPFNTEIEALKFINKLKIETSCKILKFKVIEEGIKFYIVYKML